MSPGICPFISKVPLGDDKEESKNVTAKSSGIVTFFK